MHLTQSLGPAARRLPAGLHMRRLGLDDESAVHALRDQALALLPHPDVYVREADEEAFVRPYLSTEEQASGMCLGVFDGQRLVAYGMLGLPTTGEFSAALNGAGLEGAYAEMVNCMVHPDWRGHGLQRVLLRARFALARAQQRSLCCAMASLHNHVSRLNLMHEGLRIVAMVSSEGRQRQLLAMDLQKPWTFDQAQARMVDALDGPQQQALLRSGWWGVSTIEGSGAPVLVFARKVPLPAVNPI